MNKNFTGLFFIKAKISPTIYEVKNKRQQKQLCLQIMEQQPARVGSASGNVKEKENRRELEKNDKEWKKHRVDFKRWEMKQKEESHQKSWREENKKEEQEMFQKIKEEREMKEKEIRRKGMERKKKELRERRELEKENIELRKVFEGTGSN